MCIYSHSNASCTIFPSDAMQLLTFPPKIIAHTAQYSTEPNCPVYTPIFLTKKSTLHPMYRIGGFAPPKMIEQKRTCKFYLFEQSLFKFKNNCLNMFKKFPTKMVKINMKISRKQPTRLLHPTFLFDFQNFPPYNAYSMLQRNQILQSKLFRLIIPTFDETHIC